MKGNADITVQLSVIDVSARPISKQEIFHARTKASQNIRARTSGLLLKLGPLTWFPSAHIYGL